MTSPMRSYGHVIKTCHRDLTDGRCPHCDGMRRSAIGLFKKRKLRSGRKAIHKAKNRAFYATKMEESHGL